MNKKEVAELKKNFKDDGDLFIMNQVVSAFVDSEKNIKSKKLRSYISIPQEDAECIFDTLKKTLGGTLGKSLLEYRFPNESYEEGGTQKLLYDVLQSEMKDETLVDAYLQHIVDKFEYASSYVIMTAFCTYTVFSKDKSGEKNDYDEYDFKFIIAAICPVDIRTDGLIYDETINEIAKKRGFDRIVAATPSDGFLYPAFNNRGPDVNNVVYYTKNVKQPNVSFVNCVLGCEFALSANEEKELFRSVLTAGAGEALDYDVITSVNDKIQDIITEYRDESEPPAIDSEKLQRLLIDSGLSGEKAEGVRAAYENVIGPRALCASNIVETKTIIEAQGITVNIGKNATDKVRTKIIDGRRCLVIALDDPAICVNGLDTKVAEQK